MNGIAEHYRYEPGRRMSPALRRHLHALYGLACDLKTEERDVNSLALRVMAAYFVNKYVAHRPPAVKHRKDHSDDEWKIHEVHDTFANAETLRLASEGKQLLGAVHAELRRTPAMGLGSDLRYSVISALEDVSKKYEERCAMGRDEPLRILPGCCGSRS